MPHTPAATRTSAAGAAWADCSVGLRSLAGGTEVCLRLHLRLRSCRPGPPGLHLRKIRARQRRPCRGTHRTGLLAASIGARASSQACSFVTAIYYCFLIHLSMHRTIYVKKRVPPLKSGDPAADNQGEGTAHLPGCRVRIVLLNPYKWVVPDGPPTPLVAPEGAFKLLLQAYRSTHTAHGRRRRAHRVGIRQSMGRFQGGR